MARVILKDGDDTVVGGDAWVYGTSRGAETVLITGGDVALDASFNAGGDTVILPGISSDYTGQVIGSRMVITNGEVTVRIPIGVAGLDVAFGDLTLELRYDVESGQILLGDQAFGQDPQPIGEDDGSGSNQAPVVERDIPDQTMEEDASWSYTIPRGTFSDPDGDTLAFRATLANGNPLPAWLSFDAATRTFSGTPPQDYNGLLNIRVHASDGSASTSSAFTLIIDPVNDAPVVAHAIADQSGEEDTPWSFTVQAGTFSDVDGDTLTYSVTLANGDPLPAWLSFDASTRTFSGTPGAADTGAIDIAVTVDDGNGGTATDSFTLTINDVNVAPTLSFVATGNAPVGGENPVNTTTADHQSEPHVTALADGGYVVTWTSSNQDGSGWGIYAQRYDASGGAAGGETRINTTTASDQYSPTVTGLADGGYVFTWMSYAQDGEDWGIYAQRYDASGGAAGGEILVNTTTSGNQTEPDVTGLADGGYVVIWMSLNQDGDGWGVYAQRYDASGNVVGGEILVNTTTAGDQYYPTVTALADGGYVVSWISLNHGGSAWGIYAQRYDVSGSAAGGEILVNTATAGIHTQPDVTGLEDGGYVVTWMSSGQDGSGYGIYAQRYDAFGSAAGGEIRVNTTTASSQETPTVTGLEDGGYVVTWMSSGQDGSGYGIYAQRYDASGSAVGGEIRVNTTTAGEQQYPTVTGLKDGGYVVTWMSQNQDGSGWGIYSQRFSGSFQAIEQEALDLAGVIHIDDPDASGDMTVTLSVDHGVLDADAGATGADVSGRGGSVVTITGTLAEIRSLLAGQSGSSLTFTSDSDTPPAAVDLDVAVNDGADTTSGTLTIPIVAVNDAPVIAFEATLPVGQAARVDANERGYTSSPAAAVFDDGSYVVVWNSVDQQAQTSLIHARHYDAAGNAVGPEEVVSTGNSHFDASVAALADGGCVITWMSSNQDGSGYGIYARHYDSSGAGGPQTLINVETVGDQRQPVVAGLANGGFVIAWMSDGQDGDGYGIYARQYDASGNAAQPEALVNVTTADMQANPSIAATADGGYVVVWTSVHEDDADVYSRRFDADGQPLGGETLVNTTTVGGQSVDDVAALVDGGYVVTWMTEQNGDGRDYDIHAQRFDAAGNMVGEETRVNSAVDGRQQGSSVSALLDGGYVVSWMSYGSWGSQAEIRTQRYDAHGNAIGGEIVVGSSPGNRQADAAVAGSKDGGYLVIWQSQSGNGGSQYDAEVYVQHFANRLTATEGAALDLTGVILLDDADSSGEFTVMLSADYGVIGVDAGTSGTDVTGSGTGTVTIVGTLAEIQALLEDDTAGDISFTADTNSPPAHATLSVDVFDGLATTSGSIVIPIIDLPEIV